MESAQFLSLSAPHPDGWVWVHNLLNWLDVVWGKGKVLQSSDIFTAQQESDFSRFPEDRRWGLTFQSWSSLRLEHLVVKSSLSARTMQSQVTFHKAFRQ
jgi:hypothetical protein